ncbi:MAG: hypothetical protein II755_11525 [Prevotella sp.]|nr:hypothetical protein [Prevotella sp.]
MKASKLDVSRLLAFIFGSGNGGNGRISLDWFDGVLYSRTEELGDIATEYYGD